ncbi:hypothetical protein OnM2_094042 [Erysiphe neolycopersici]|uniref:MICOS complex subunit MIC12 n=1 Tax=Erysiphe neolycopersici TaxID=212602 RepID=A0A420HBQ3_9PEZI|nr:hypothetical protein OnM2_094042 [Erysiphe neolycopersici]
MGFSRSFMSSATLTTGIIYLTLHSHQQNRRSQAAALHSQSQVLNSLLESKSEPLMNSESHKISRNKSNNFLQTFKIRWNEEIENIFWWIHSEESSEVRNEAERSIIQMIGRKLLDPSQDAHKLKDHASAKLQKAFDSSKATIMEDVERIKHQVSAKASGSIRDMTEKSVDETYGSERKIVDQRNGTTNTAMREITSGHKQIPQSQSASIEETLQKRYVKT